jgi:hypothetical protein
MEEIGHIRKAKLAATHSAKPAIAPCCAAIDLSRNNM